MKTLMTFLLMMVITLTASAQDKNKNAKHNFEVSGVCDQCKKRIEKAAFSVPGVKSAEYHIDDQTLHLILNEQKSSVMDVKNAVAKAGHDTDEVKATEKDYQNLHHCCKYERK